MLIYTSYKNKVRKYEDLSLESTIELSKEWLEKDSVIADYYLAVVTAKKLHIDSDSDSVVESNLNIEKYANSNPVLENSDEYLSRATYLLMETINKKITRET